MIPDECESSCHSDIKSTIGRYGCEDKKLRTHILNMKYEIENSRLDKDFQTVMLTNNDLFSPTNLLHLEPPQIPPPIGSKIFKL